MKICSECQSGFNPTNNRQLACSSCKVSREIRIKRERRRSNPEVQKRHREAVARYKTRNHDKVLQGYKTYYHKNIDTKRQYGRDYQMSRRQDAEYRRTMITYLREYRLLFGDDLNRKQRTKYAIDAVYRQKIINKVLSRKLDNIDRESILERDKYTCTYCGDQRGPFHIDHMIPLSRGGPNTSDNLTTSCKTCNLRKHTMTAEEFLHACTL